MNRPSPDLDSLISCRSLIGTLAILLATAMGGCMLSVESELSDIEVTQHDIAFEGVPNAALLGDVSTALSFTQERPDLDFTNGLDSSAQAVKVELIAKTGIQNFDFLRALRITMTPKVSTDEPIEIINYEKADGAVVGATLTIPSKNPLNILEQWNADGAVFNVQVAGNLPEQAWSIDMSAHFSGKISYKY
jgi:hypothetical protein